MRILQIGASHPRNEEFIQRICFKFNYEYHRSLNYQCPDRGYDLVWSPSQWFNPDRFPNAKILYGPQFWVFPNPNHRMFSEAQKKHGSRCIFTCLSQWNYEVYTEFVDLSVSAIPFKCLPFGLDIQTCPVKSVPEFDCIIYFKARNPECLTFVTDYLSIKNIKYKIFKYGSYVLDEYLQALKKCSFVIWIGSHESQGFAVSECLASNTPLYIFDAQSMKDEYVDGRFTYLHHTEILKATTVPYWDSRCGERVSSENEFSEKFDSFIAQLDQYRPWEFVNETLSDEVCFKRICDAFGIENA
jgi:hypothetical protein